MAAKGNFTVLLNVSTTTPATPQYMVEIAFNCTIAVLIFCTLGTASNFIVFLSVITDRHLRNGTGRLVLQLTGCNFFMCCVIFPTVYYFHFIKLQNNASLPSIACSFLHPFTIVIGLMGDWYDAILALNRFVAVIFPLHYPVMKKRAISFPLVGVCWLLTLMQTIPVGFGLTGRYDFTSFGFCTSITVDNGFASVLYSINSFGPFLVIATAAFSISCRFGCVRIGQVAQAAVRPGQMAAPAAQRSAAQERRRNMSNMLVASFFFNCLTQLPQYMTATVLLPLHRKYPQLLMYLKLISIVGFAVTPIVFFVMNRDYRLSCRRLLCRLPLSNGLSVVHPSYSMPGKRGLTSHRQSTSAMRESVEASQKIDV